MTGLPVRSARRGSGSIRFRGRGLAPVALAVVVIAALTGCATSRPAATHAPDAGAYPVATAGPNVKAIPEVSAGGYRLVSAGDPVLVHLDGATALVTVAGPDVDVPQPSPGRPVSATSAPGVLTVTVAARSGSLSAASKGFLGLDEDARPIRLTADRASITATPGHPATLHLSSRFTTGHTTLTWQPTGHPLITWDFTVEID